MEDDSGDLIVADGFLGGRLLLRQLPRGHRAGADAVLLAAAASVAEGTLIDIGAGVGAAGLAVVQRSPHARVMLVEIDADLAKLAASNIEENGLGDRARAIACDVLSGRSRRLAGLEDGAADVVIANPPWLIPGRVRASPDARRALAHVAREDGGCEAWLRAAAALLKPDGRLVMIHRADALGDALAACRNRFGDMRILPVHPRADAPAIRLLLRARKGRRGPTQIAPGLVLHEADGGFTPLARAIHLGEAQLDF